MHLLQVSNHSFLASELFPYIFLDAFLSLIIFSMEQAEIPATYLSASIEWSKQQEILNELMSQTCHYKLLYVTPEKIAR